MRLEEVHREARDSVTTSTSTPASKGGKWRSERKSLIPPVKSLIPPVLLTSPTASVRKQQEPPKADDRARDALSRLVNICSKPLAASPKPIFDASAFHRTLSVILRELRADRNATGAVKKVRAENVPQEHQAKEFADLITRVAEDGSGPARRAAFAFIVGLCSSEESAFNRKECLAGTGIFFQEVYQDLAQEVPRLNVIMSAEFLPMLRVAMLPEELDAVLPQEFRQM